MTRNFKRSLPLALLLIGAALLWASPTQAQTDPYCDAVARLDWRETRSSIFTFVSADADEYLTRNLLTLFGDRLEPETTRLEALFGAQLPRPVIVRLYPDAAAYRCLNPLAAALAPGATHAAVGNGEIALLADAIAAQSAEWLTGFPQVLRYEVAYLLADSVTRGKAPVGLLEGVGRYVQDPAVSIAPLSLSRTDWQAPDQAWTALWEQSAGDDWRVALQQVSQVAFLVDVHGWPRLRDFLERLGSADAAASALSAAYGQGVTALEADWRRYYPEYFGGRYAFNVLHNFDLAAYRTLVTEGAYTDAAAQLDEVVPFLQAIGSEQALAVAQDLRAQAQLGMEAGGQIEAARYALQTGDYLESVALADQAQEKYTRLNNYRRLDEISAYRDRVGQILVLHEELNQLKAELNAGRSPFTLAGRMIDLGERMARLGDIYGQNEVLTLSGTLDGRQQQQQMMAAAVACGVALALLLVRVLLLRWKPPLEAQL